MKLEERYELGKLVTFTPNQKIPIHNWFKFKEGFSRDFVNLVFKWFKVGGDCWVLDPFCGVGTTVLTAKEFGVNALGSDLNPFLVFTAKVKIQDYNLEKLKLTAKKIFSEKFARTDIGEVEPILKKAFSRPALEDIMFFKSRISCIDSIVERSFFDFTLIVSAMKISYVFKDGAVVRFFRRGHPPLRRVFKATVKRFIRHLKKANFKPCRTDVLMADARRLSFAEDEMFNLIVTSPPYLNKPEYIKAFTVEEKLLPEYARKGFMGNYIGFNPNLDNLKNPLPEEDLPKEAEVYFADMKTCLGEMYRVLAKNGKVVMVVGQAVFPDRIVKADVLMGKVAEQIGFKVDKRIIVNRRVATKNRTVKTGEALESILIMSK